MSKQDLWESYRSWLFDDSELGFKLDLSRMGIPADFMQSMAPSIAAAFRDMQALEQALQALQAEGLEVIGPTNHGIFQSIYFRDPNGHRLELVANTCTEQEMTELNRVAPAMLEEWSKTKKAPQHAAWLHEKEFAGEQA